MYKPITKENPFGPNRYGFLWETLNLLEKGKHLDYGAYDGNILKKLLNSGTIQYGCGVDINKEVIDAVQELPKQIELCFMEKGKKLSFADETFDTVSMLDVLEHIYDQHFVLSDLYRVLKPGGKLIVTVPQKHMFSFLDIGNFKFIFPTVHKFVYQTLYGKKEYIKRYVKCENGLFGDIEKSKMWHQHFTKAQLSNLLRGCGFVPIEFDGSGFFARPLYFLSFFFPFSKSAMHRIINKDYKFFS